MADKLPFIDPLTGLDKEPSSTKKPISPDALTFSAGILGSGPQDVGESFTTESKYDKYITRSDLGNIERERALMQPLSHKAFNSVVGGIASGVLTAIEDTGYILDLDNNIKRLQGLEEVDSNIVSDVAKQAKERLGEVMPIYREQRDNVFDWSDPGFYFEALKGILDSAVGFAIPGMAASKGIGAVQRAMRLNKYLSMIKASPVVEQMINSGLSGYITNFGEGKMMAIEQYENSLQQYQQQLLESNYDKLVERNPEMNRDALYRMAEEETQKQLDSGRMDEFSRLAGAEADKFIARNKMFALTDAIGLHGLYKGKNFTRNVLKDKNFKAAARRLTTLSSDNLLLQAGKEGAEEIGQNVLQMEGEYQTLKNLGQKTDSPDELAARIYEFATSDKALLEGMMGLFGGGPQRILTETLTGANTKRSREEYKKRYQEQQTLMQQNTEFLNKKLGQYAQAQFLRSEAIKNGQDDLEQFMKDAEFITLAGENLQKGTVEQLERSLKDIATTGVSEEERIANGWDENYQQQAQDQLGLLRDMEKSYIRYNRYENQRQVFDNRMNRKLFEQERQRVKEVIDELQTDYQLQDIKDPDTKAVIETHQKNLNTINEHINELDKAYKHLTSFETQQKIRTERKNQLKQLKINDKKLKDKVKQEKQEEKAQARKERQEKKAKAEQEKTSKVEEEADVTPDIEREINIDVSGADPFDVAPPDVDDQIDVDPKQTDQIAAENQKAAKNNFDTKADDLISDLESGAIVKGEDGLTKSQRRVGLFEEMIEDYKDSVGRDEISFEEIIDALVEKFGTDRLTPIFGQLEAVYKLTEQGRNYVPINDLNEYRKLSPNDKKEREAQQRKDKQVTRGVHTTVTEQEIDKALDEIETISRKNDSKQRTDTNQIEVDYLRVNFGHNIIAYLSRVYDQVFKKGVFSKREISNNINEDIQDISILDPKKYPVGTKVTLKVEDIGNTDVYAEGDFTKKTVKWESKKDNWNAMVATGTMSEQERQVRYEQQVPIAVYVGDQKIGYLHETEWINETNVNPDNVRQDREYNHAIRKEILKTGEYETKISYKSDGYLFKSTDGEVTLAEAMPDESLPLVVGSQEQYKSNRNKAETFENILNKKAPQEGVTYVVVPVGKDKHIAIPLKKKRLGETPEVINSIVTALDIFIREKEDEKSKQIVQTIYEVTGRRTESGEIVDGILITTPEGITEYIEMFINNYDIGSANDLKDFVKQNLSAEMADNVFVSMFRRGKTDDINLQFVRGNGVGRRYISKAYAKNKTDAEIDGFFNDFRQELAKMFSATNLDQLGRERDIALIRDDGTVTTRGYEEHIRQTSTTPFLAQNIGTEEEPNYVYTIQPVIELDFSEITGEVAKQPTKKVEQAEEKKVTIEEKTVAPKPVSKRRKNYTNNRKINLDNLESGAYAGEDENELFKRLLKEWNNPETSPERKAELDEVIASMYYADGEMISYEEKRQKVRRKMGLESDAVIGLTEDQIKEMEKAVEARIEGKRVKGVIIKQLGPLRQKQLTDYIRSKIVEGVLSQGKIPKTKTLSEIKSQFESDLATAKENLQIGQEDGDEALVQESEAMIQEMSSILDNWNLVVAMTEMQMDRIDGVKKIGKDKAVEEDEEDVVQDQQKENANWSDSAVYTNDPADGLAREIKRFFSGIGAYRVDGDGQVIPDLNYLGEQKTMSFQEVYETVQRITPNLRPNFEELMAVLEDIASDPNKLRTYPFMQELVTKLRSASDQVKNQFVTGMTNHNVDMRFIMFHTNRDSGVELREYQSNANEMSRVVISEWKTNLIAGLGVSALEDTGEYVMDKAVVADLKALWDKWKKTDEFPPEEIRQFLDTVGIVISDQTFDDLIKGKVRGGTGYRGRSLRSHVLFKGGLIRSILDDITSRGNIPIENGENFLDESVVKNLARHESEYALYSHSNSHRTGNKTVYSYSLNKFLINRVRELRHFEDKQNPLLDSLADMEFNGHSGWVSEMRKEGGDNEFVANFGRWVFSLEPIKRRGSKARDNKELHKLSEADIELTKIGMLQSSYKDITGNNNRVIKVLYPTTSDKTTVTGLRILAANLSLTPEGEISEESIDLLFDRLVRPEISRIQAIQRGDDPNIDGYIEGGQQFLFLPELNKVEGMFNSSGKLHGDPLGDEMMGKMKEVVRSYVTNLVDEKISDWTQNGIIGGKKNYLNSLYMSGNIASKDGSITKKNPLLGVKHKFKVKAAATDMVFQYLIANAEVAMTMNGDPALYYKQAKINKGKSRTDADYNFVADAEETYINIGKRLAADIAPGYELAQEANEEYVQGFGIDPKTVSERALEITKLLDTQEDYDRVSKVMEEVKQGKATLAQLRVAVKGLNSAPYYSIDSADAQEYTTWREHLRLMHKAGEITTEELNKATKVLSSKNPVLDKTILSKVMQPMKPVYADNMPSGGVERRVYIKSSAFPLLPQLTKGTDLDNLRIAMETQGVDRYAFSTAVKVGNLKKENQINLYDEQGNIKPANELDFSNSTLTLKRKGFRIQQKVPYDPSKSEIRKVTQASKNLLINMLNVEGFLYEDTSYTGAELQKIYHDLYGQIHKIEQKRLLKEVTVDGDPTRLNVEALRNILLQEAGERSYPISDQELLNLDEELKFMAFSPSANKYEALLNSIVTSRVIRLHLPGKSYVLGSEEGFVDQKNLTPEEFAKKIESGGIVTTSSWTGKLLPARKVNGRMLPAQAIIPWKLRDKEGRLIEMEKYIIEKDGRRMLDMNRIDKKALQLFGMRIPNQGPNSQSWIEVVGFLPQESGDLFIATKDYVTQMGSDFDVDKLYTYMYNLYESDETGIHVHKKGSTTEDKIKALQNKILDIHIAIHRNPDDRVQAQIASPLGFWKLKDIAEEIVDLRRERNQRENAEGTTGRMFTGLSDQYQREKFKNASAGKSGVGVFSLDSMFNAVAQGKSLTLMAVDGEPFTLTIGNESSEGDLSGELALDEKTYKSDVIAGYQSAAVDNEKEQILDKLNINNHTFKAIKVLNQLGFTETVPLYMAQDILVDYVKEVERLSSITSGYQPNVRDVAMENVRNMPRYKLREGENDDLEYGRSKLTTQALRDYIRLGEAAPNYRAAQRAILNTYMMLDDQGQSIQSVQSAINPDSAGLGKSVMESLIKEDQIFNLPDSSVKGAEKIIGDFHRIKASEREEYEAKGYVVKQKGFNTYAVKPDTINGHAVVYGLFTNNDLWKNLFHYHEDGVKNVISKIEEIAKGDNETTTEATAERRLRIWKEIKSYVYSENDLGLHDSTVSAERLRLLYDKFTSKEVMEDGQLINDRTHDYKSLASIVKEIKQTDYGRRNPFLARLEPRIQQNGSPSLVTFRASAAEQLDETYIYMGIIRLLNDTTVLGTFNGEQYTAQRLMQELILYSYITGGIQEAIQFVKYIPASYLVSIPFANRLSNKVFTDQYFGITNLNDKVLNFYSVPSFVEQYIQHNPETVSQVTSDDVALLNNKKNMNRNTLETSTEFVLNETARKRIGKRVYLGKKEGFQLLFPPYVTVSGSNSFSGMKLFKYEFTKGKYVQIDTLGEEGISEYNANTNSGTQVSLNKRNKAEIPVEKQPKAPSPTDAPAVQADEIERVDETLADMIVNATREGTIYSGRDGVGTVLNEIINANGDPYLSALAAELFESRNQLPPAIEFRIEKTDPKKKGRGGSFNYTTKNITMYSDGLSTTQFANRIIMHELLHGLTGYKLLYYEVIEKGNTRKNIDKEKLQKLIKTIPGFQFTEKDRKAIKSIQVLMNQAKNHILKDEQTLKQYEEFLKKLNDEEEVSMADVHKFYGLTDIHEFVTQALTDIEFQTFLNSIEAPSGKTFWQALKERIFKLLQTIFPNINENSVLAHTVYDVMDLITTEAGEQKAQAEKSKEVPPPIDDGFDVDPDGVDPISFAYGLKPSMTQIKKDIGLTSKVYSDRRKNMILKKLGKHNEAYGTSHRLTFKPVSETSYEVDQFVVDYTQRDELEKQRRDFERNEDNLIAVEEIQDRVRKAREQRFVTAGETEAELGTFNEEGDFLPPQYFPASETHRVGPKYQRYMELKEDELKALFARRGKIIRKRQETDNVTLRRKYVNQINEIDQEIDDVKNQINHISNLNRLDQISVYADEDMQTLEKIFSKKTVTGKDLDRAGKIINIWQRAADFSGNEPHIFYDAKEFNEANTTLKEITDKFKEWGRKADEYNNRLIKAQENYVNSQIEDLFGEGTSVDFSKPLPDVSFLVKNMLDVTEVGNNLFQAVGRWVKDANFAAKLELDNTFEEIDRLIKKSGIKDFSIFQQTFSNDDPRTTGELVYRFSQSYFDWSGDMYEQLKATRESVDSLEARGKITQEEGTRRLVNANRKFIEELRSKVEVFDARILFYDKELYDGKPPTKEQKEALESKLKNLLGENAYKQYYELNQKKIEEYKDYLESVRNMYEAEFSDNPAMAQAQIDGWIAKNSPYLFAEQMEKGYDATIKNGVHPYPSNRFVSHVPKRIDSQGKETGFYDDKFSQIEQDENLLELYNYMFDLLQNLKNYLPEEKVGFMRINSIPFLKKKVLEQIADRNGKGAFSATKESILNAVRMDDLSEVEESDETKQFQIQMVTNNKARINNYITLKDTEYRAENDGARPSPEMVAEWRKEIIHQISQEKSFDLGRVLKAFAATAITYKHKSSIEDQMRMAWDIIDRALERRENAAGDQVTDKYGNLLSTKGLRNLKDMMENFMDVAYWGYPSNRPEGKSKKKILTDKEKELEQLLNKSQEELDQLLEKGQIDQNEYATRSEVVQEQLKTLGGVRTTSKYGDVLLKYIQLKGMGWNVFAAFANMGFGFISNVVEASDGRNYSMKSFGKAQALVLNSLGRNITFNKFTTGNARKIRVLMDRFDVLKESKNEIYKSTYDKLFKRLGDNIAWMAPYNTQSRSEYFNQAPVMIAMMMDRKVKVGDQEVSVWNLYDQEGNIKEGLEFSQDDMFDLKNNIDQVIKMNHGNYDPDKPLAAKRKFIGRAALQFRTWALQGFAERFQKQFKDYNLNNRLNEDNFIIRKGRYRSYASFFQEYNNLMGAGGVMHITLQLLRKLIGLNTTFDEMVQGKFTEVDAANMRKNMTEIVIYVILAGLTLLMKVAFDDDDDKRKQLATNFMINQMARLVTDIAFYTNPIEFERLARNAIPAFTLVTDAAKFVDSAMNMVKGNEDILQSGPNKGESRTWRDFKKLIPGPVQYEKLKSATGQVYKKN